MNINTADGLVTVRCLVCGDPAVHVTEGPCGVVGLCGQHSAGLSGPRPFKDYIEDAKERANRQAVSEAVRMASYPRASAS